MYRKLKVDLVVHASAFKFSEIRQDIEEHLSLVDYL